MAVTADSVAVLYDQQILVGDGQDRPGDCLRAAMATLLQLDAARVPHFVEFADWMAAVRCYRDDLAFRWPGRPKPLFPVEDAAGEWVIGCGQSPRGHLHAVVLSASDGSMIHDPHPSRTGLIGPPAFIVLRRGGDSRG